MNAIICRLLPPIALLILAACTSLMPPTLNQVPLAPGVTLSLPTPAELGKSVEAAQLVTARHGGDVFVFEGRLSVNADTLALVGTDPLGRRAMTLHWSVGKLEVERAAWFPSNLHPENILADIALLYWPEHSLRGHLRGAKLESVQGGRVIRRDGADVISIHYEGQPWSGTARLRNFVWGYEIEVRSQEVAQ